VESQPGDQDMDMQSQEPDMEQGNLPAGRVASWPGNSSQAPPPPSSDDWVTEPVTWYFEPGTFVPVAKQVGASFYSIVCDHLGSPVSMFDSQGRQAWAARLDIYGKPRMLAGNRGACPFRFPGQYEDEETGLYYNRFRYYDPDSGQYVSQDPIHLRGGLALYAYVTDPLTFSDPLGLAATYCGKTKRWRDENGKFTKRPDDPADLVKNGKIDHPSLMEWQKGNADWNPAKPGNQWNPSAKFPTGGFNHDMKAPNGDRYRTHGHGSNSSAPAGSNAASGPTTTVTRVHNGNGEELTTSGTWAPKGSSNPNDVHIPLENSPY
jgi:RHS repeat-associated protein